MGLILFHIGHMLVAVVTAWMVAGIWTDLRTLHRNVEALRDLVLSQNDEEGR